MRMTVVFSVSQPQLLSHKFTTICCTILNLELCQMLISLLTCRNEAEDSRMKDCHQAEYILCCHGHFNELFTRILHSKYHICTCPIL